MLETERLLLRPMKEEDYSVLYEIFSDKETMKYYPAPFNEEKTKEWIIRNQRRYRVDGFGLWAVVLKEENILIGDCGITMQNINGTILPEIGYHIHPNHQRKGYASEAAKACIEYAFDVLGFKQVYSYMKYNNEPSIKTAEKNGMRLIDEFADEVNRVTKVYAISKEEWKKRQ